MIRTTVTRPARAGVALASVAGLLALAGCGAVVDADGEKVDAGPYTDGSYTAEGSYATPESVETIQVTVTLQDDRVTEVTVVGDPQKPESAQYQGRFIGGIAEEIVGRDIDELDVSRVAGSSLTSGGFNAAIEQIKQQAAA
ncbi:MAG: FMN-binding protein [Microbacterium sp.]|uniref:FMN-binding protein n=1 Tax=Microbacterium sp. TaxID=51671 RepID=UPI003A894297